MINDLKISQNEASNFSQYFHAIKHKNANKIDYIHMYILEIIYLCAQMTKHFVIISIFLK